jgi:hypothetical protein
MRPGHRLSTFHEIGLFRITSAVLHELCGWEEWASSFGPWEDGQLIRVRCIDEVWSMKQDEQRRPGQGVAAQ